MKKIKFLAIAMAMLAVAGLTSCNRDKDLDIKTYDLTNATPYVVTDYDYTPTAAYGVSFTLGVEGETLMAINGLSKVKEAYYSVLSANAQFPCDASIVDVGKARSVSSIKEIPTSGYEPQVAAQEGHGYVMKIECNAIANSYPGAPVTDPETMYVRFIITEAIEAGGYKVAIEYPFEVEQ